MTKSIMVVGTASNVGKSVLATALCRILYQEGYRVSPFKAQNMSLNSAVTPSGREIGRAQAVQAEACGILPNEHMNPVLLKPTGDMQSQIVLQGRVVGTRSAKDYFSDYKDDIWEAVVESYQYLADRFDVVVLEGAGSPVEMNLKARDIANMRAAHMADASVILVSDIDRGGVFASVVGTLELLGPDERQRVKGIIINKFRGDASLFEEGKQWLESYTGIPVIGVIPYITDLGIDEEDSVGLESDRYNKRKDTVEQQKLINIGIVHLPHMSNFTDFDPLFLEPDVLAYFCTKPEDLLLADVIVLPGTKSTLLDLQWLHREGWVTMIHRRLEGGTRLIGICGGYQMLGYRVLDPNHYESCVDEVRGLGVFDSVTTMHSVKRTLLVEGVLEAPFPGIPVQGYEIHMGITTFNTTNRPFARVRTQGKNEEVMEGCVSENGLVIGTYLHGIFHNDVFRTTWLNQIRSERGLVPRTVVQPIRQLRDSVYDRLAEIVRANIKMENVLAMLQG